LLEESFMPPNRSFASRSWLSLRRGAPLAVALAIAALVLPAACLERPVTPVEPITRNQFVDEIKRDAIDKIDLLFMIDNSISMADKQAILKQAVPVLLTRLVTPACVDENRNPVGGNSPCASGVPEFKPIKDIHIGVITSNLGDMGGGAQGCTGNGDGGRLLATVRPDSGLRSWNNQGFLAWDPDTTQPRNTPPGMTSADELRTAFEDMVGAASEKGCGYEAVLESWYRFLIDPDPPQEVVFDPGTLLTTAKGTDSTILEQRAKFLRPDSLVAVIMLSDENDCSLTDYGRGGHLGAQVGGGPLPMPRANSACERDPNDRCCAPCDENPPDGCPAMDSDPICSQPSQRYYNITLPMPQMATYDPRTDETTNLRCYDQKRRFGRDFLQPLSRYVDGLRSPQIYNRRGELVPNPLFAAPPGSQPRDPSLVYLAGITGVPWQDVADEASWSDPTRLKYLTAAELEAKGRWEWMLGKDGKPPLDPLMVETPYDRTDPVRNPGVPQSHPAGAAGGTLVSSTATSMRNPINGHETNIQDGTELQYACIFPLTQTRDCRDKSTNCDCNPDEAGYKRALCDATTPTTQTHAKAYPGTRQLQVLRQFGENSIVASICPKITQSPDPASDPNYGYNPAVNALVDRLKERIGARCLPRPLEVDEKGQVPCAVVEARRPDSNTGSCGACVSASLPGRKELAGEDLHQAVRQQLLNGGHCGRPGAPACEAYCLCEVEQFKSPDLELCRKTSEPLSDKQGYCYVDDTLAPGESPTDQNVRDRLASIAECPATQRRLLRFSSEVPAKGAVALIACTGKPLGD
jgi:hypothetical protein